MTDEYNIDEKTFSGMTVKKQNWILYTTFNAFRDQTTGKFKVHTKVLVILAVIILATMAPKVPAWAAWLIRLL